MSFTEVLAELPAMTVEERQALIHRALQLDDHGISNKDEILIDRRMEEHRLDPKTAVSLEEMKGKLRDRLAR